MKVLSLILLLTAKVHAGVVELTDRDFDIRVKGKNAMIMFYSPNCGHCQRMKPAYESLAAQRSISGSGVLIGRVDCTEAGKKTCSKFGVNGFPTVKFISRIDSKENIVDYDGNRELSDLTDFVLGNNRPSYVEIPDKSLKNFVQSTTLPVIVGFFKDSKSKLYQKLITVATEQKRNYLIGISFSEEGAKELSQTLETVVIFRQKQYESKLEDKTITCSNERELSSCLSKNQKSIVEYRDKKNHDSFINPMITAFISIDPHLQRSEAKRLRAVIVKYALKNTDITFTISQKSDYEELVSDIAPQMHDKDIVILGIDRDDQKFVGKDVGSIEDTKSFASYLEQFISDFKKGDVLERYIKSQPIETPDDGNVRVLTAHNFQELVTNSDKDVLVEFYAPWCGHCKKLAPIYQQLATLLKDEKNIIIAKYDATANEPQKYFSVEGFPTIYLAKAGKKTSPIQYSGKRETKDILEWLRKNTKHRIQYDGEIPDIKEEL